MATATESKAEQRDRLERTLAKVRPMLERKRKDPTTPKHDLAQLEDDYNAVTAELERLDHPDRVEEREEAARKSKSAAFDAAKSEARELMKSEGLSELAAMERALSSPRVQQLAKAEGDAPAERASDAPWDGSADRFTDSQWKRSCLLDRGGSGTPKEECSLPVREPDGELNRHALAAAQGALDGARGGVHASAAAVAEARHKLAELRESVGLSKAELLPLSDEPVDAVEYDADGVDDGDEVEAWGRIERRAKQLAGIDGTMPKAKHFEQAARELSRASRKAAAAA